MRSICCCPRSAKFNSLFAARVDALYASVIYIEALALELQGSSSLSVNLEIRSVSTDSKKKPKQRWMKRTKKSSPSLLLGLSYY